MGSKIYGGLSIIFLAILFINSGDNEKDKKDTSVNAEPSTITEVKTNTGKALKEAKKKVDKFFEKASTALNQVNENKPEEKKKDPSVVVEKKQEERKDTATLDDPYGKIENKY